MQAQEIKAKIERFWGANMLGLDEKAGFQMGTKEFIQWYRKIVNQMAPFRLPLMDEISSKAGMALEVGCGSGMDVCELAERNRCVVGVDLSKANAKVALSHVKALGVNADILVADVEHLPFVEGAFDTVYSYGVLHHTPGTETAISQLHYVLKKGASIASCSIIKACRTT